MKTSIVVTTYNHSKFIATAIESIVSQDVDNLEIIVVDDGSLDNTFEIVKRYSEHGVVALSKPNGGPSSATNFGIEHATGDVIALFSGDDVLLPDSIRARRDALLHPTVDIVSAQPIWIGEDGRRLDGSEYINSFASPVAPRPLEVFERLLFKGNFICAPSVAFTRRCWETVGHFDELLWQLQDYEYWLRAAALGFQFRFLDQPLIEYRTHKKNLSSANDARLQWELDAVMSRAPSLLDPSDLREILFGAGFRDIDLGLAASHLAPFVNVRNTRESVRTIGRWQLSNLIEEHHGLDLINARLS